MLVAVRDISIGDTIVKAGDHLGQDVLDQLPAGRIEQLKSARMIQEAVSDQVNDGWRELMDEYDRTIAALTEHAASLTAEVKALKAQLEAN